MAQLKRVAGTAAESLEVAAACRLPDLLRELCERHPAPFAAMVLDPRRQPHPSLLVFLEDQQIRSDDPRPLPDGAEITLLTPMAGG